MATNAQRTLVLVKPDGVQRGLVGEIISRLERRGLKLVGMKLMQMDKALADQHYSAHTTKGFYPGLLAFMTSRPIVAMVWEGKGAVDQVRQTMGATDPAKAAPGSVRGDLGIDIGRNLIHGSDSPEAAEREVGLFFKKGEVLDYTRETDRWITE